MLISRVVALSLCLGLAHSFEDKSVYQYLVDNGYTSFARLLQEANVDTTLGGTGPYTVFAPTDAAIAKVDPDLMVSLGHNTLQLQSVMKYHVSVGFILIPQIKGSKEITTLAGQSIHAVHSGLSLLLNNGTDVISPNDVICNNGIVHTIDTVMIPPVFGYDNIASVLIMKDDMFKDTFMSFLLSDLSHLLESGEYTLFAPLDAAWAQYSDNILHPQRIPGVDIGAVYTEMLKYHMVPGMRTSSMLTDGQQLFTLHGTPVNITLGAQAMVNNAHIIKADIPASNGVIHAIDHLLFPRDLLRELISKYQAAYPTPSTG